MDWLIGVTVMDTSAAGVTLSAVMALTDPDVAVIVGDGKILAIGQLSSTGNAKVYDLAQPYFIGMPHHPVHPPYLFGLVKKHGEFVSSIGASSASEALALGAHVGTHIDALCHFSRAGKLCDGGEIAQSYTGGIERLSVDTMAPIFRRGVLLDIAGLEQVDLSD